MSLLFDEEEPDIDAAIEKTPGDTLLARIVCKAMEKSECLAGVHAAATEAKSPTGEEPGQIEGLIGVEKVQKVTDLFDGDYKKLLLFLTVLAPEYLLDRMLSANLG